LPKAEDHSPPGEITALLAALRGGDRSAFDQLLGLVYEELRRRAHRQLARRAGRDATLCTTGLVHEAYLRLAHTPNAAWEDRHHFFGVAVKAMRSVVVDSARRHFARKRGGRAQVVQLDEGLLRVEQDAAGILAVHQALDRLAGVDERLGEMVEMRFFGGLSVEEMAEMLGISESTVKRGWVKARTLLHQILQEA
jgi:RNA polymerase sigma factor (TIGR02999 family)